MFKSIANYLVYWQPVISRCVIYMLLAAFTTFLDKTADIKTFSDFNLWMWFRVFCFCALDCLISLRSYIDGSVESHKIMKVKSGDTEHLSKADIDRIKRELGG